MKQAIRLRIKVRSQIGIAGLESGVHKDSLKLEGHQVREVVENGPASGDEQLNARSPGPDTLTGGGLLGVILLS